LWWVGFGFRLGGIIPLPAVCVLNCPRHRNPAIVAVEDTAGYRRLNIERQQDKGETLIVLSFSGGGTRAAA